MNIIKVAELILAERALKPGNYTVSQLKRLYSKLPKEQQDEILQKAKDKYSDEQSILHKILVLCKKIVRYDTSFQNLNSEQDRAKQTADKIQRDYEDLLRLVEQVDVKDTKLVKEMLQMLKHPWLRVLGDQLKYKDNLEKKLYDLDKHIAVQNKENQYALEKQFSGVSIPNDISIEKVFTYF